MENKQQGFVINQQKNVQFTPADVEYLFNQAQAIRTLIQPINNFLSMTEQLFQQMQLNGLVKPYFEADLVDGKLRDDFWLDPGVETVIDEIEGEILIKE